MPYPWIRSTSRLLVVFAALALLGATAAVAQTKVAMVSLIVNSSYAPLWVAHDQGLFAKHGIDADLTITEGAWRRLGPQVPIGVVGIPAAMLGIAEGKDLKVLLPVDNTKVNSQLIAAPAIRTPDAMRGKRIGTATFGAGAWINAQLALRHLGLDPSRDGITFVDVGGSQQQIDALEAGRIDAIVMEPGRAAALRAKGFNLLLDLEEAKVQGVQSALVVTTQFLRERPDVVERIVTALVEGFAFALAPQNEQVVRETIAKRMNLSSPGAVDTAYRSLLARSNRGLTPSLDAMRTAQQVIGIADPRVLAVKVEELADDSIVRQLTTSGTVERLYRSYGVK